MVRKQAILAVWQIDVPRSPRHEEQR